ncbi:hypothetical protein ACH4D3_37645 [Streptomyces sp. NPDC018026]|uniref:hypothetical protein n=1 Tax=Streptomyces sp. NPDC018026 TaxID=3365031 RepID=UPI0037BB50DE
MPAPDDTARTFTYAYDSAGRIASRTFLDAATTTYTYDADGRQKPQTANGATITYGYDEAGNLTTTKLPSGNGYADTRTYDRIGRLASITTADGESTLASWTLKRDAASQPMQLDTVRADGFRPPQYYGYDDDAGRLASWCTSATGTTGCPEGSALVKYTYDKVGNRATMAKKDSMTTYTYDVQHAHRWPQLAADGSPRCHECPGVRRPVRSLHPSRLDRHRVRHPARRLKRPAPRRGVGYPAPLLRHRSPRGHPRWRPHCHHCRQRIPSGCLARSVAACRDGPCLLGALLQEGNARVRARRSAAHIWGRGLRLLAQRAGTRQRAARAAARQAPVREV